MFRSALAARTALIVLIPLLTAAACRAPSDRSRHEPLDLVVITLDTTRADRIGAYGHAAATTPVIDALAARGVRFEHAFAPAPTTLPSHASLFTGLYPPAHGARVNGSYALDPQRITLAERLKREGYRTAAFIGAFPLDARFGLDRGFDRYDDRMPARGQIMTYAERDGAQVTDAAIEWLRAEADGENPLFLWVHYFDAHAPYEPPAPATGYDGEIAFADSQIGRLLEAVDAARSLERTVVVLTADHGESLGEHGEDTHGTFLYDATVRVPLILVDPARVEAPQVVDDRIVSLVDVFPTVLGVLGLDPVGDLDGEPLLAATGAPDRAIYLETLEPLVRHGWAPLRGLRTLDTKLIEAPVAEFYRIGADPGELQNVFVAGAPAVRDMQESLTRRFGVLDVASLLPPREEPEEADREVAVKLSSLGYVSTRAMDSTAGRLDPKRMLPLWRRIDDFHALARAGRTDEALLLIDEMLAVDPDNGRAWLFRGMLLQSMGRMEEAEESVRASVRVAPDTDSWARLAEILYLEERFAEGDEAVAEVRRIDPLSGQAWVAEGIGLTMRDRYDEALHAFARARELDPANAGPRAEELAELTRRMR